MITHKIYKTYIKYSSKWRISFRVDLKISLWGLYRSHEILEKKLNLKTKLGTLLIEPFFLNYILVF